MKNKYCNYIREYIMKNKYFSYHETRNVRCHYTSSRIT